VTPDVHDSWSVALWMVKDRKRILLVDRDDRKRMSRRKENKTKQKTIPNLSVRGHSIIP
jgi:hypothetical protein